LCNIIWNIVRPKKFITHYIDIHFCPPFKTQQSLYVAISEPRVLISEPRVYFEDYYKTFKLDNINLHKVMYSIENNKDVPRICDVIKSFVIHAKNIRKVHIKIGGVVVWKCHYINAGLVKIVPFDFGLLLLLLNFSIVSVNVECDEIYKMYTIGMYLPQLDRRYLSRNTHKFDYVFYNDNKLYTMLRVCHGMCIIE
jgi:hypothetical protein